MNNYQLALLIHDADDHFNPLVFDLGSDILFLLCTSLNCYSLTEKEKEKSDEFTCILAPHGLKRDKKFSLFPLLTLTVMEHDLSKTCTLLRISVGFRVWSLAVSHFPSVPEMGNVWEWIWITIWSSETI